RLSARVVDLKFRGGQVRAVTLDGGERLEADHVVLALPHVVLQHLCRTTSLAEHAPHLADVDRVRLEWSNSIQCFLKGLPHPLPSQFAPGVPTLHLDSPWSFTTVVQGPGFWRNVSLPPGTRYVLSATWSEANVPGAATGKPATACDR